MIRSKRTVVAAVTAAVTLTGSAAVAAPPAHAGPPPAPDSIVDVAVAANGVGGAFEGQFDTLIDLLTQYPDLVRTLDSRGQYTVFAPTDTAFDELFAVVDPTSLTPSQVEDVLRYHVARGHRDATDVTSSTQIRMLNGDFALVDGATIDGADIVVTDVPAGNGVIHAVSSVLLPPSLG